MKRHITYLFAVIAITIGFSSCKKEKGESGLKAVFSYVADGYKVNFTNFSANATTYSWDFGDGSGQTATTKTPQHIFTKKGDFLVSLTAKNATETNTFKDTVSIIGPNIKIDGDYSDWQYVEYSFTNPATFPGSLRAIKTFAGSTDIFFYLEGDTSMKMEIIDVYIDGDNNPNTGFKTFLYPAGSGADFLCEGSPAAGWGDVFSHVGPGNGFAWNPFAVFADALRISAISSTRGKKVIEFSIKKSTLGTIKNFINLAIIESTSGYAEVGKIPEAPTATSKFLQIPL
jgi:PKD repeat protein